MGCPQREPGRDNSDPGSAFDGPTTREHDDTTALLGEMSRSHVGFDQAENGERTTVRNGAAGRRQAP